MWASGLPYLIFYEPAFYSLSFLDIELYLSEKTSLLGNSAFEVSIFNKKGELQQKSDPLDE
jgi:hypothetical protein